MAFRAAKRGPNLTAPIDAATVHSGRSNANCPTPRHCLEIDWRTIAATHTTGHSVTSATKSTRSTDSAMFTTPSIMSTNRKSRARLAQSVRAWTPLQSGCPSSEAPFSPPLGDGRADMGWLNSSAWLHLSTRTPARPPECHPRERPVSSPTRRGPNLDCWIACARSSGCGTTRFAPRTPASGGCGRSFSSTMSAVPWERARPR